MTLDRLTQFLPLVTLLIVLGVIAASAAPVIWHWQGEFATAPQVSSTPAPAAPPALLPVDIGPILTLAPFGELPPAPIADRPLGETTLDLILLGVVVRSDPAQSRALISAAGTAGQYAPQDQITDRAVLIEVATDHVILQVDGTLQTLSFPTPGDTGQPLATPLTGTDRLLAAVTTQTPDPDPQSTADYIDLWRERIAANPGEVLAAIGLIPTPEGYVIAEDHDSGVDLAGLRPGDLVTTVNGQPVGNVETDRQLYDDVAASGMARIEIERDGRMIIMSFPLQ